MSDGININPAASGTLALVGADLCTVNSVASTYVPLTKLGFGANEVFTYVTASAGLPVAQQGTWTTTVSGSVAVTGTFWQTTQPVSIASLPALAAGTAVIGHVVVDTAPTTAVTGTFWQATQPVSLASLPALPAGTNTIGAVNAQSAGDVIEIAGTTYTVLKAFANATASGNTTVVALTSGKKIRVLKYTVSASAAVNVFFNSSTAGAISSIKYLGGAGAGLGASLCHFGHFDTATGETLQINLSTTANVGVDVLYILV